MFRRYPENNVFVKGFSFWPPLHFFQINYVFKFKCFSEVMNTIFDDDFDQMQKKNTIAKKSNQKSKVTNKKRPEHLITRRIRKSKFCI